MNNTYTVKSGDTLAKIASRYGMKWQDLYDLNKTAIGNNPNLIKAGATLSLNAQPSVSVGSTTPVSTPTSAPTSVGTVTPVISNNQTAVDYAQKESDTLRKLLSDTYYPDLDKIKESQISESEARKNSLLGQIEANKTPINDQYNTDSRQAYINSVLGKNSLNERLGRLGLASNNNGVNTGYGVTQNTLLDTNYSTNLAGFQNVRKQNLQKLVDSSIQAEKDYGTEVAGINTNYLTNKSELDKYIDTSARNTYDTAFNNFVDQERYKDSLKQQEIENDLARKQLAKSSSSGGAGPSFDTPAQIKTNYYSGVINPDTQYGTFGTLDKNGIAYQPNNIGGKALSSSGKKVSQLANGTGSTNSSGINVDNQTVWSLDGKYYIWNGSKNKYEQVVFK